jgi:hypothetical protein
MAKKIVELVRSGTGSSGTRWARRLAVSGWRIAMSDEEWVAWGALDDEASYRRVGADFGFDARPKV